MFANPPTTAESKRAPTPLQQQYTASPQPPNPQPISQPPQAQLPVQPSNTPRPPSVAAFQPPIPSAQFLSQPPPGRNVVDGQAKTANHPNGAAPTPQFIGNAYQHTYRLPQTPQPQAASPQPHPQANGRATPRPPNGIPPTAQAKALAMATARAGRLPAGSPPNAAAAQHPNAQLGHFSYHSPHLRPAVPPAGTAQLQAAHAAMVAQAARASPSPAPNAQNGGRPNPAAVEGGQPMGQPAQAAAAANFLAYQNMLRANANAAYPGMNWQQQLASMPGRGMPMPAANGHQLQMQMQQAAGMMPGGQHAMPHHPVPVGGGGKGQPGHPGR
ncbi:hypothetical protein C8F01DRAFT_744033 [Mycena amicta]|nr:hypothetical protein C8F01DRAFT_744033 [Mycena amicta]